MTNPTTRQAAGLPRAVLSTSERAAIALGAVRLVESAHVLVGHAVDSAQDAAPESAELLEDIHAALEDAARQLRVLT